MVVEFVNMETPQQRKVYIGNLSYNTTEEDLKEYVSRSVEPVSIELLYNYKGLPRGAAIAEFATPEDAEKVIGDLNEETLEGRTTYLRPARPSPSSATDGDDSGKPFYNRFAANEKGTTVFFGNLPWSMAWQDLKDFARAAGPVIRADVPVGDQRRSKGYGTVVYETKEAADEAIDTLNGKEVDGRVIEVRLDRPLSERMSESGSFAKKQSTRGSFRRPVHSSFASASGHGVPSNTIHVSNLPWQTTDTDLVDLFRTVGVVEQAEIQRFPDGRPSGSGLVKLLGNSMAAVAIESFNGYRYGGQDLVVTYARYPPPLERSS